MTSYSKQHYKEICIVLSRIARIGDYNTIQINALSIEFIAYFKKHDVGFNEIAFRALLDRLIKKPLITRVK